MPVISSAYSNVFEDAHLETGKLGFDTVAAQPKAWHRRDTFIGRLHGRRRQGLRRVVDARDRDGRSLDDRGRRVDDGDDEPAVGGL
jgi:hypothetical protein